MRLIRLKAGFLALCLAAVTCCNTALAQVTYRLNRVPLFKVNASDYNSTGLNNLGLAIGFHELLGITHGFVYDHYGLLGLPKTTHTMTDLVTVPFGWNSKCGGLNDMGQVVGAFEKTTALGTEREGFLLDLDIFSPTIPIPSWRYLPKPAGAISSYGRKINNDGLVLIEALQSENTQGVYTQQYVYDSRVPVNELVPLLVPRTVRFMDINDSRQFAGSGVRLTLTEDLGIQQMLTVPGAHSINTHGMLGLQLKETRDSRGRIITPSLAARYSDTVGVEKLSTIHSGVWDINDSGDICGFNGTTNSPAIYRANGWLYLKDLVRGTPDDVGMFLAAGERKVRYIANRGATGFGNLYVIAIRATKNGKNTSYDVRHFLLEPESP